MPQVHVFIEKHVCGEECTSVNVCLQWYFYIRKKIILFIVQLLTD